MKSSKNAKTAKSNRQRYFHMIIKLGSILQKINLSTMDITSLVDLLRTSNFASQKVLETILYRLIVKDRGRRISIKNFDGQLERDSRGIPYWNFYLQTTAVITSRSLKKAVSKELFKINNFVDPNIHISHLSNFQQCDREKLFSIPESEFYPGHFSRDILKFDELLRTAQIKEAIKERPKKYRLLIETKAEIKNT